MTHFISAVRFIAVSSIMLGVLLAGNPIAAVEAGGGDSVTFTIVVKVSPEASHATSESVTRKDWERSWKEAKFEEPATPSFPYTDVYMEIAEGGGKRMFAIKEDGVLVEAGTNLTVAMPAKIRHQWLEYADLLRDKHYGDMLEWGQAKSRVPLKGKLTVFDLETGLSFQAQRRAGSHHADVQPLTRADTAVMKQIYGGKWSWKRRAILVLSDDRPIAASMHGMPHGGDGIPDNGFSGHFCIHFLGSSTHRSGQVDLAHQLMVHKAAGKLPELLGQASPERMAESLFEALHQQDGALLRAALHGASAETQEKFEKLLRTVDDVRVAPFKQSPDRSESVEAEIPVKVTIQGRGGGLREETFRLQFVRETIQSPWILTDADSGKGR
ncbi:hypothetical protein FE783_28725 [Paenibacillus mesophilus]|uniref:hypothetical protein n=1 Tax=Paenibacillus mesophilus TaxID=2582849 RepID=UPI00110F1753|nr:hypothetical protein [Paenibacillus mesophilus]TMV45670.1 hypothetical protein FE783_28725 [Paenibacillus mesophilus]